MKRFRSASAVLLQGCFATLTHPFHHLAPEHDLKFDVLASRLRLLKAKNARHYAKTLWVSARVCLEATSNFFANHWETLRPHKEPRTHVPQPSEGRLSRCTRLLAEAGNRGRD